MRLQIQKTNPSAGFLMMDLMIVILLLAIAIVPMMASFSPSFQAMEYQEKTAVLGNRARGTLNRLTGLSYGQLEGNMGSPADLALILGSAQAAAEETAVFRGQSYVPVVNITDASGGTGGLVEVTVILDTLILKQLKTDF